MKLESQEEIDAFELICNLASEWTSREGCNDLTKEGLEKFRNLKVDVLDVESQVVSQEYVTMDFQVIDWLRGRVRKW